MHTGFRVSRFAVLASIAGACSSPVETALTPPPALTGAGPFFVSSGIDQVFVSLPPGTLPGGSRVSIRVRRSAEVVSAPLIDGGMDPVAVQAVEGDTLSLEVNPSAGAATTLIFTVPVRRPPVVVRTVPSKNKRDVLLNIRIVVVFSEPIDPSSLSQQDFELRSGIRVVPGQINFADAQHTAVEFTPLVQLEGGTDYELVLRQGIRDLEGTPLQAVESIRFTTLSVAASIGQLAFVRDSQIHLIRSDGTGLQQLTSTGSGVSNRDPAWSPDGRRLAFVSNRGGNWAVYVMDADGSNVVQRTGDGYLYNATPAWSPDGRTIAFSGWQSGQSGVYLIHADEDGSIAEHLGWDRGDNSGPAWSPDGRKIVFSSDWRAFDVVDDLYVMNADGSALAQLLLGPIYPSDGLRYYYQPAWSPDGRSIAVVLCPGWAWERCYPNSSIAMVNADGSGLKVIVPAGSYAKPTWSPDGRTIAFSTATCRECPTALRYILADGSGQGLIVSNGHSPAWRP